MKIILSFFLIINMVWSVNAQIPIADYKKEIKELRTTQSIQEYWNNLAKIQVDTISELKKTQSISTTRLIDSLSISTMVRIALMIEKFKSKDIANHYWLPSLCFLQSNNTQACLVFCPIVIRNYNFAPELQEFTENNTFENNITMSLSMLNYNYLLNPENDVLTLKYYKIFERKKVKNIAEKLCAIYENSKSIHEKSQMNSIGVWRAKIIDNKSINADLWLKNIEINQMSDNQYYMNFDINGAKIMNLLERKTEKDSMVFKPLNGPFGWSFVYEKGKLFLNNENGKVLIEYELIN